MKTIRVMLSVPEPMLAKLTQVQKEYCYPSMQQTILQILRDSLYASAEEAGEGTKLGRPRKIDESRILSRPKIFDKKGKTVSI